jgi:hypothetical protein
VKEHLFKSGGEDNEKPTNGSAPCSKRTAVELLRQGTGLLTRSHLRDLGLERRGVDAVFRRLPIVALPGYTRPLIRVEDYLRLIEECTYLDDRVRR